MKKIETIHFNGIDPNVTELAEIIPKVGFRRLIDAAPEDLPSGSVVIMYNSLNNTMGTVVICEHVHNGFTYMLYNDLNHEPDIQYMNGSYDFNGRYYKVLLQLPEVNPNPSAELLKKHLSKVGFKSLAEATPDDLPQGCVALLSGAYGNITCVIVRVLSTENRRFLYLHQGIVAGDWHSNVIMNKLKPFKNYSYLVIS